MSIFEVSVMLSMPVVFFAVGIWSAVKKLGTLNRFSVVVIIAYLVFNVVEAMPYVKHLSEESYVKSDFFILNVFCVLSLGLFLLGYGMIYLAKRTRKHSTPMAFAACNKTSDYHKTPAIGDAFLATTNSSSKSARFEVNTPTRRVILIIAFLYSFVGMVYVTFFSITTARSEFQSPITILFQDEAQTYCKNSVNKNNKSEDCLNDYHSFAYLTYRDLEKLAKTIYGDDCYSNGGHEYMYSMYAFHYYWVNSIKYWKDILGISIAFLFSTSVILSFAYGVGQKILSFILGIGQSFLGFCFSPFKKLWRWIKTGR